MQVCAKPCEILFGVGRVQNQEKGGFRAAVDDQVIHHAPGFIEHQGIARLPDRHPRELVGEDVVERLFGLRPLDQRLPHVGNVKKPRMLPHRHMFGDHTCGVLHRQKVTGKGNDASFEGNVLFIQGCFLFHGNNPPHKQNSRKIKKDGARKSLHAPSYNLKDSPKTGLLLRCRLLAGGPAGIRLFGVLSDTGPFCLRVFGVAPSAPQMRGLSRYLHPSYVLFKLSIRNFWG